jgi:hypothetical protein
MAVSNYGRYSHAIVCRIPSSFKCALGTTSDSVNLDEARREHEEYTKVLRGLGLDVIELPPDEHFPDCPFVEDTAVVCNGIALMCRPGHPSRAKEVGHQACAAQNGLVRAFNCLETSLRVHVLIPLI